MSLTDKRRSSIVIGSSEFGLVYYQLQLTLGKETGKMIGIGTMKFGIYHLLEATTIAALVFALIRWSPLWFFLAFILVNFVQLLLNYCFGGERSSLPSKAINVGAENIPGWSRSIRLVAVVSNYGSSLGHAFVMGNKLCFRLEILFSFNAPAIAIG